MAQSHFRYHLIAFYHIACILTALPFSIFHCLLSPRTRELWRGYRVCPVHMYVCKYTYVRMYVRKYERMFAFCHRYSDLIYKPILR